VRYLFPLNPYNQQRQFEKPVWVYPAHLAMYATYLRNQGYEVRWGYQGVIDEIILGCALDSNYEYIPADKVIENDTQIDVPFEKLPFPDRTFTDAKNKRWQSYGNYKFHPATHMMASNLCWYGKCTFCIDTKKLEDGEKRGLRTVDHCMEEIDDLIRHGYREVFDDSGTFPLGRWLDEFCLKMLVNGRRHKIKIGCNMRVQDAPWGAMSGAGFRFILFGIESANQVTLDKIKKSAKAEETVRIMKEASEAGLEPHGTFMTGYPWETEEDEKRTIELCHYLLRKGYLKTAQASVYSPPRTCPASDSPGHIYLPRFYDVYKTPEFWITKISDIKKWEDFTYLIRGSRLVIEEKVRKACHLK
jgi:radical SAM superfamily enzyme YgiQ (UPF0313 family)